MAEHKDELDGWAGEDVDSDDGDQREELAENRTKMAEDRTVLANERTFASWIRTGLASVGIGLGFHALFTSMQPWWAPRAIASAFFLVGIYVTVSAERRACSVVERLHAHKVQTVGVRRLRIITLAISLAIGSLLVALWTLPIG